MDAGTADTPPVLSCCLALAAAQVGVAGALSGHYHVCVVHEGSILV